MTSHADSDIVGAFLGRIADGVIEAFIKAVLHEPALSRELGAQDLVPENVAAFARSKGYAFTAAELTDYVESRLAARLPAAECEARRRFLERRARGELSGPETLDQPTQVRSAEIAGGAPLDRAFVLRGGVVAVRGCSALLPLLDILLGTLRTALATEDMDTVHTALDFATLRQRTLAAYTALSKDARVPAVITAMISGLGMDPRDVLWEWPGFRLMQPEAAGGHGQYRAAYSGALPAHRDTWYGSPQHQINIWGPVRPIPDDATLRVLPRYFRKTFANSSRGYDTWQNYAALALSPVPRDTADESEVLAPPLGVGDMIAFSGQQLHASAPNTTDRMRVSFEFRLLHRADEGEACVPANVDYYGAGEIYKGWFDADGNEVVRL